MLGFRTKPEMSKPGLALNEARKKILDFPDPPLGVNIQIKLPGTPGSPYWKKECMSGLSG